MTPEPVRRPRCTCRYKGHTCPVCRLDAQPGHDWQALATTPLAVLAPRWRVAPKTLRRWKQELHLTTRRGKPPCTTTRITACLTPTSWHSLAWICRQLGITPHQSVAVTLRRMVVRGEVRRRGRRCLYEYALASQERSQAA